MKNSKAHKPDDNLKHDIIRDILPDIPFDGWSWPLVEAAFEKRGLSAVMAEKIFPEKMLDVLDAFADVADAEMLAALQDTNPDDLRIRDRIYEAVLARFTWLNAHKEAVRESVSFWAFPSRKPRAGKMVWRTADVIWNWAGDTAKDYNHYTKRTLLSGIIVSTTMAWLNDDSADMNETRAFLSRRIDNVLMIGKFISKFKKTKEG